MPHILDFFFMFLNNSYHLMSTYPVPDYYAKFKAFAWVKNLIFTATL